ncbi:MAG: NAD(P)H-hydrate dehydratase [Bacteroidetes bacterium]|nr:NAD(P)H-hydrate dehydratase [Bacteroidota bacterium]
MKIFKTQFIKLIDKYTIENETISSINLMERAATKVADWLINKYSVEKEFFVFVGPGNNGGDALVVARLLAVNNYKINVFIVKITEKFSDDFNINFKRLKELSEQNNQLVINTLTQESQLPVINSSNVVVDGIFGSGLSRPLENLPAIVVNYINKAEAEVVAIDIPSGLFGEDNSQNNEKIINADFTLTFQFPKLSFLFPENDRYVGEWHVLDIRLDKNFINKSETDYFYFLKNELKLKTRKKFAHKGNFGHALLIAGSYEKTGAAVLASRACLRSGVGRLTVHVPESAYEIMQTAVPEAMLNIDETETNYCNNEELHKFNAIGIGPGIGKKKSMKMALKNLIENSEVPIIFDADAINILGENKEWLKNIPANSIFTPHPKEFERLVGKSSNNFERNKMQVDFAKKYNAYIVLKGANTAIACPDGKTYFNSSGNPGMATAGSGDVLTGIILSLLAQAYSSKDAALIGVFIHGLAGDIAAGEMSQEALIASDIIYCLGKAFISLKVGS